MNSDWRIIRFWVVVFGIFCKRVGLMSELIEKKSITVKIVNELGLHARPAATIAKLAQKARSGVWISSGSDTVDAASIIDILTLACVQGTEITLHIDDDGDEKILEEIAGLIEKGLEE